MNAAFSKNVNKRHSFEKKNKKKNSQIFCLQINPFIFDVILNVGTLSEVKSVLIYCLSQTSKR